jgi:hypothetical protein
MSFADQTCAAILEMKTNPEYRQSLQALNSGASPQDMVKTLVTNYERPGDPDKSINQRLQHLGNLSTDLTPSTTATAGAAATPTKGPNKGKQPATKVATSPTKTADVPSKEATAVEASTSSQDGGFRIPGDTSPNAAALNAASPAPPPPGSG